MEERGSRSDLTIGGLMARWGISEAQAAPVLENVLRPKSVIVKVLLGIGAWMGAILFAGFLGLLGVLDSLEMALLLGSLFIAAAVAFPIVRGADAGDEGMAGPFVLALGLIGQVLVGGSVIELSDSVLALVTVGLAVEGALLVLTFSSLQRFVSAILILFCLLGFIHESQAYPLTHLLVGAGAGLLTAWWIDEPRWVSRFPRWAKTMEPASLGLAVGLILLLAATINRDFYESFIRYWWGSTAGIAGALLYAGWRLLGHYGARRWAGPAAGLLVAVLAPTVLAPGIAFSLLLCLLGFFRRHALLGGLGLASLVFFTIFFYYNIQTTLLLKALALMASGAALWGVSWWLGKREA